MDALLFRGSDKLENLQFRLGLVVNDGKQLLSNAGHSSKRLMLHYLESAPVFEIQDRLNNILDIIIQIFKQARSSVGHRIKPILRNFTWKWINTPILLCFAGFVFGTTLGFLIGRHIYQNSIVIPRDNVQAIQCLRYQGKGGGSSSTTDVVSLVHGIRAPNICRPHDVIVQVEAGSLQQIDLRIVKGYGRYMRYWLNKFSKHRDETHPVTLGRDCVGSVLFVGTSVRRLEVGDLVWTAVPYWAPGVLTQRVALPEHCVALRPAKFGAQASCSFPYAGTVALHALKNGRIHNKTDASNKRVLIIGGCTPVGCILTQVLKAWGAHVTATCTARASPVMEALGAADIIPIYDNSLVSPSNQRAIGDCVNNRAGVGEQTNQNTKNSTAPIEEDWQQLKRHLHERQPFNLVIITHDCHLSTDDLREHCITNGLVLDTRPITISSDDYSALSITLFGWFMFCRLFIKGVFGWGDLDCFNEVPMDYEVLDRLSSILEKYRIKPVVGKVYHATDIVAALKQVSASSTIGTTVVTFRNS